MEHNRFTFFDRIRFSDWPLKLLYNWFEIIEEPVGIINENVCEALIPFYNIDQRLTRSEFRDSLFNMVGCGGKLCRNNCQNRCATAGYFKQLLAAENLQGYNTFDDYVDNVLDFYFFKLNDQIRQVNAKTRIGVLMLYFERDDLGEIAEFIKKERFLIMNQISNEFYVTDYILVDAETKLFNHIKHFIDAVVIIADARYATHHDLDDYYEVLRRFRFLKIFIVKTEDIVHIDDEHIRDHFQRNHFPENEIIIHDWLFDPLGFPNTIRNHVTMKDKLKICFSSYFVRNRRRIEQN